MLDLDICHTVLLVQKIVTAPLVLVEILIVDGFAVVSQKVTFRVRRFPKRRFPGDVTFP